MLKSCTDTEKAPNQELEKALDAPDYFLNRELSWIRFNARVLEEASDFWHPLLERVKFIAICGSNLDEFFMTRIPRLMKQINKGSKEKSMDGMSPIEQIEATRREILPLIEKHTNCLKNEIIPALEKEFIHFTKVADLQEQQKKNLREFFQISILPDLRIPKEDINIAELRKSTYIHLYNRFLFKEYLLYT